MLLFGDDIHKIGYPHNKSFTLLIQHKRKNKLLAEATINTPQKILYKLIWPDLNNTFFLTYIGLGKSNSKQSLKISFHLTAYLAGIHQQ